MKTMLAILIIAVLLPGAAAAVDAEPRAWALGWADGLTLRHQLTSRLDLNLAAGPNDRWDDTYETRWDEDDPPSVRGLETHPRDDRREQGWVRLGAARELTAEGPVRLSAQLSLQYLWSREQDVTESIPEPGVFESVNYRRTDRDDWNLDLALRVGAALTERFWLETRFGLVYAWHETNIAESTRRLTDGDYSEDSSNTLQKTKTFADYGWWGLSSIDFVFWF